MADNISPNERKKNMRNIRSSHTKIEDMVCSELWKRGYRFRRNVRNLYGKPDIAIKKYKLVIFIDSCFWHGCDLHSNLPKSNVDYWENKIRKNKERDVEVTDHYHNIGWSIIRIWEHHLKRDSFDETINQLCLTINKIKSKRQG